MRIAFNRICCHRCILISAKGFPQMGSRSRGCVYRHRHRAPRGRKVSHRCPSRPLLPPGPEPHCLPTWKPLSPSVISYPSSEPGGVTGPHPAPPSVVLWCLSCHRGKLVPWAGTAGLEAALHPTLCEREAWCIQKPAPRTRPLTCRKGLEDRCEGKGLAHRAAAWRTGLRPGSAPVCVAVGSVVPTPPAPSLSVFICKTRMKMVPTLPECSGEEEE